MKYLLVDEFSEKWRFTEEGYNVLPKVDLEKIHPLSKEYSCEKWSYWISNNKGQNHLMLINGRKILDNINLFCNDCGWGNTKKQNQVINSLIEKMSLQENEPITFYWSSSVSVETEWSIFTRYWTDFCYSSDDSNIIIPHNSEKAIIYVEDKIWVVNRKECFGQN